MNKKLGLGIGVGTFVAVIAVGLQLAACGSSPGMNEQAIKALSKEGYETSHSQNYARQLMGVYQLLLRNGDPVRETTYAFLVPSKTVGTLEESSNHLTLVFVDSDGYGTGVADLGELTKVSNLSGGVRGIRSGREDSVKVAVWDSASEKMRPLFTLSPLPEMGSATAPLATRQMLGAAKHLIALSKRESSRWKLSLQIFMEKRPSDTGGDSAFNLEARDFIYQVANDKYDAFDTFMKNAGLKIFRVTRSRFYFTNPLKPSEIARSAVRVGKGTEHASLELFSAPIHTGDELLRQVTRGTLGE